MISHFRSVSERLHLPNSEGGSLNIRVILREIAHLAHKIFGEVGKFVGFGDIRMSKKVLVGVLRFVTIT